VSDQHLHWDANAPIPHNVSSWPLWLRNLYLDRNGNPGNPESWEILSPEPRYNMDQQEGRCSIIIQNGTETSCGSICSYLPGYGGDPDTIYILPHKCPGFMWIGEMISSNTIRLSTKGRILSGQVIDVFWEDGKRHNLTASYNRAENTYTLSSSGLDPNSRITGDSELPDSGTRVVLAIADTRHDGVHNARISIAFPELGLNTYPTFNVQIANINIRHMELADVRSSDLRLSLTGGWKSPDDSCCDNWYSSSCCQTLPEPRYIVPFGEMSGETFTLTEDFPLADLFPVYGGIVQNNDNEFLIGLATVENIVEEQTIVLAGPSNNSYSLRWNNLVTAPIAWNATAATVQAALRTLEGLSEVVVTSTGASPNFTHTVEFWGVESNVVEMTVETNTTGGSITIDTTVEGDSHKFTLFSWPDTYPTYKNGQLILDWGYGTRGPLLFTDIGIDGGSGITPNFAVIQQTLTSNAGFGSSGPISPLQGETWYLTFTYYLPVHMWALNDPTMTTVRPDINNAANDFDIIGGNLRAKGDFIQKDSEIPFRFARITSVNNGGAVKTCSVEISDEWDTFGLPEWLKPPLSWNLAEDTTLIMTWGEAFENIWYYGYEYPLKWPEHITVNLKGGTGNGSTYSSTIDIEHRYNSAGADISVTTPTPNDFPAVDTVVMVVNSDFASRINWDTWNYAAKQNYIPGKRITGIGELRSTGASPRNAYTLWELYCRGIKGKKINFDCGAGPQEVLEVLDQGACSSLVAADTGIMPGLYATQSTEVPQTVSICFNNDPDYPDYTIRNFLINGLYQRIPRRFENPSVPYGINETKGVITSDGIFHPVSIASDETDQTLLNVKSLRVWHAPGGRPKDQASFPTSSSMNTTFSPDGKLSIFGNPTAGNYYISYVSPNNRVYPTGDPQSFSYNEGASDIVKWLDTLQNEEYLGTKAYQTGDMIANGDKLIQAGRLYGDAFRLNMVSSKLIGNPTLEVTATRVEASGGVNEHILLDMVGGSGDWMNYFHKGDFDLTVNTLKSTYPITMDSTYPTTYPNSLPIWCAGVEGGPFPYTPMKFYLGVPYSSHSITNRATTSWATFGVSPSPYYGCNQCESYCSSCMYDQPPQDFIITVSNVKAAFVATITIWFNAIAESHTFIIHTDVDHVITVDGTKDISDITLDLAEALDEFGSFAYAPAGDKGGFSGTGFLRMWFTPDANVDPNDLTVRNGTVTPFTEPGFIQQVRCDRILGGSCANRDYKFWHKYYSPGGGCEYELTLLGNEPCKTTAAPATEGSVIISQQANGYHLIGSLECDTSWQIAGTNFSVSFDKIIAPYPGPRPDCTTIALTVNSGDLTIVDSPAYNWNWHGATLAVKAHSDDNQTTEGGQLIANSVDTSMLSLRCKNCAGGCGNVGGDNGIIAITIAGGALDTGLAGGFLLRQVPHDSSGCHPCEWIFEFDPENRPTISIPSCDDPPGEPTLIPVDYIMFTLADWNSPTIGVGGFYNFGIVQSIGWRFTSQAYPTSIQNRDFCSDIGYTLSEGAGSTCCSEWKSDWVSNVPDDAYGPGTWPIKFFSADCPTATIDCNPS
jgi:hypothetical protein